MSDPRLTPFSGRVAHDSLRGRVTAPAYTAGLSACVIAPLADLLRHPEGPRDRQVLRGAAVTIIDQDRDMAYVIAGGYCGWLRADTLGPVTSPTHRVIAPATHLYTAPNLKSPEAACLSLNVQLRITGQDGAFFRTDCGHHVPHQHLASLDRPAADPVTVAETLLGVPYLWGGNSHAGLDCSALVQLALQACNRDCPADSDLQERAFSACALAPGSPAQRGDLLFWRGHVAWVASPDTLLHANAHSMSVAYEPMQAAIARIAAQSPVTAHIRLPLG